MVPRNSLDSAINKLYLGEKSKPMSEVWPELWKNHEFKLAKDGHIFNAFVVVDKLSDYFCVTTKNDTFNGVGACYDIIKKQAFPGYTYDGHDDNVVLSANKPIIYYVMHKVKDNLQLCQFKFKKPLIWIDMKVVEIVESSPWRSLCRSGEKIYSSDSLCETPYIMPVLKGFLNDENFYLFGESHVTIFSVKVFTEPGKKFPVIQKNYTQFIYCRKQKLGQGIKGVFTLLNIFDLNLCLRSQHWLIDRNRISPYGCSVLLLFLHEQEEKQIQR